jgi:hypothetical protein
VRRRAGALLCGVLAACVSAKHAMIPTITWAIHDPDRPQPPVVTPPTPSADDRAGRPPSDAIVLFDGRDLSAWRRAEDGAPAAWAVRDGYMEVAPGSGSIQTAQGFGDCQLHIEWATPTPPSGEGQERGNSGVFLMGRYEVQVLDSYRNTTYPDGQAAAMYGHYPPLVNASRKPGEWQTYDIAFTAPRFTAAGTLDKPAIVTVFHNGVIVHNATPFWGPTAHKKIDPYTPDTAKGPIALQDHGNPVRYRNVWIRTLNAYS